MSHRYSWLVWCYLVHFLQNLVSIRGYGDLDGYDDWSWARLKMWTDFENRCVCKKCHGTMISACWSGTHSACCLLLLLTYTWWFRAFYMSKTIIMLSPFEFSILINLVEVACKKSPINVVAFMIILAIFYNNSFKYSKWIDVNWQEK